VIPTPPPFNRTPIANGGSLIDTDQQDHVDLSQGNILIATTPVIAITLNSKGDMSLWELI